MSELRERGPSGPAAQPPRAEAMSERWRGEEGTSLVLALAFITLVSVVVAGALGFSGASFQTNTAASERINQRYAADGGIDYGIRSLQDHYDTCASPSSSATAIGALTINGRAVNVTCQTLEGTSISVPSTGANAITVKGTVATSIGNSTKTDVLTVDGPMFSATAFSLTGNSPDLAVTAELTQRDPACTSNKGSYPNRITGSPWTCVASTTPTPDPDPDVVVPADLAPGSKTYNGTACTVLYPGRYDTAPTFAAGASYYLASGTYYFSAGAITLRGTIFGGAAGFDAKALTAATVPCASDAIAQQLTPLYSPAGTGVTIILGGNATLTTATTGTTIELFTRAPAGADAGATPGVAIWARADATAVANYTGSTAATPLTTQGANTTTNTVVIHGAVSLPDKAVSIGALANTGATAGARAQLAGGAVVNRLSIVPYSSSNGAVLAKGAAGTVGVPATDRRVLVTATAASTGSATPTTVRATVKLPATQGGAPQILSWRTV